MKIKRFVAKDMRSALEQIKAELGEDAVIMSNKKIPQGVELMAAVDQLPPAQAPVKDGLSRTMSEDTVTLQNLGQADVHHSVPAEGALPSMTSQLAEQLANATSPQAPADSLAALLKRQAQPTQTTAQTTTQSVAQPHQQTEPSSIKQQFKNFTERLESTVLEQSYAPETPSHTADFDDPNQVPAETANQSVSAQGAESAEIIQMRNEMASIRKLLEHQVAGLLSHDSAQRNPNRAMLINRMIDMGISSQMAEKFAGYIGTHVNEESAWQEIKSLLAEQINTTNNDIIRHGGVVSLVGPTGVGKTTTIAKLAARFAQIHGADNVALISTDTYRIAGFEQLSTYARIIGCEAKLAKDHQALDDLIQHFAGKKLVLIDTAGMGQRDIRLSQYLTTLIANARVHIRNYLVLSANTQQRVMQENVDRFKKIPLAGCIFTKLDESLSFGEIISTSIQNGLAIGYLTDGQRVPEDIKVANAEKLVTLADKMAMKQASYSNSWNSSSAGSTTCA